MDAWAQFLNTVGFPIATAVGLAYVLWWAARRVLGEQGLVVGAQAEMRAELNLAARTASNEAALAELRARVTRTEADADGLRREMDVQKDLSRQLKRVLTRLSDRLRRPGDSDAAEELRS